MKYLQHLNLKPSHFNNGVASFDQVSHTDIVKATLDGADFDRSNMINNMVIDIINKYKELMAFGKIDESGLMKFEGFSGFPFDSKCVEYLDKIIGTGVKKRKINHCNIFVEF